MNTSSSLKDRIIARLATDFGYDNPIVTKSLRARMRGSSPLLLMLGYGVFVSICLLIAYVAYAGIPWQQMRSFTTPPRLGYLLFNVITWCQAVLIFLIAPIMTAGSIAKEHEKRTAEMLALTPLSPREIIIGKTMSVMLIVLTLLASSLPISSICLMLGGISLSEILVTYLCLAAWALFFSSLGIFWSSLINSTAGATIVTLIVAVMYFQHIMTLAFLDFGRSMTGMGGWRFVFTGLNAGPAASYAVDTAPVLGFGVPVALVGIITNIGMAIMLLTFSATRLKYYNYKGTFTLRLGILAASTVGMILLLGNIFSMGAPTGGSTGPVVIASLIGGFWVPAAICIPFFLSGTVIRMGSLAKTLSPTPLKSRILQTDVVGGFWFLMALFVLWCLGSVLVMAGMSVGRGSVALHTSDWILAGKHALALLTTIVAIGMVGVWFSSFTSRVAAGFATTAVMVISAIGFPIIWAIGESFPDAVQWHSSSPVLWSFAYLWPGLNIVKACGGWHPGTDSPNMLLPLGYEWLGCTIVWGAIALIALWGTSVVIRRKEKTAK